MSVNIYRKALRLGQKDRKEHGGETLAVLEEERLDLAWSKSRWI